MHRHHLSKLCLHITDVYQVSMGQAWPLQKGVIRMIMAGISSAPVELNAWWEGDD